MIQVTFDGRFVEPIFQLRIGIRFDQRLHQALSVQLYGLVQGQGATWHRGVKCGLRLRLKWFQAPAPCRFQ